MRAHFSRISMGYLGDCLGPFISNFPHVPTALVKTEEMKGIKMQTLHFPHFSQVSSVFSLAFGKATKIRLCHTVLTLVPNLSALQAAHSASLLKASELSLPDSS